MPSPSVSDFDYAALFYPNGGSSDEFVKGRAGEGNKLVFSFQRPDKTENVSFTLEVFAFKKGTDAFSRGKAALFGKTKNALAVNDGSETIEVNETIALEVNASSTAKGEVSLKIEMPDGCTLTIDETSKANFTCEKESEASNTYVIAASEIAAGAYKVNFTVMDGEKLVQVFTEYINVLHGMRTDTWGGMEKGAAKEIKITDSESTVFFVRGGTDAGWYTENGYANIEGKDGNAGTFLAPFATIQKAVDEVIARTCGEPVEPNDGTTEYTIYLDGKFTATSSAALADFEELSQPLSSKILGLSASSKAILDGNNTARGIVVGSGSSSSARKDVNLTLENLTVQNAAGNGITLYCQSSNSRTIKNCEIKNNAGRGIYKYYGSLDLQDCTISGNITTSDGGGVYSDYGSLKMTGCTVSGNEAKSGAGIYHSYTTSSMAFTMKDCTISGNIATNSGGGVYVYRCNFTMEGCTISGNQASNGGGGYFCNYTGYPIMKDCTVSGNKANVGKGVYVTPDMNTTKLMLDGTTKFAKDDDIYLHQRGVYSLSTVGVMSTLTTVAPIATITPFSYTTIRQVLSAGTGVEIEDFCDKFALSEEGWQILPKPDDGTAGVLVSTDTSTIYLNSKNGDDANFGLSASNAVKTLAKAIELFEKYNSQRIMVCQQYTLSSEESGLLDRAGKSKLTLMRYDGSSEISGAYTGTLLYISSGNVTITNVTLDGNKEKVTATSQLLYINGGNVTLGDGATICNNKNSNDGYAGAVYMQDSDSTFTMTSGATITGNESTASNAGGVQILYGTFKMSGGEISGNTANGSGGGVHVLSTGKFRMSGGTITDNTASAGGGVSSSGTFTMTGGTISGNNANNGGGVSDSGTTNMSAGEISGNTAAQNGGGVYVSSRGTFTISGGEITGNTAGTSKNGVYVWSQNPYPGKFTNNGGTVQSD